MPEETKAVRLSRVLILRSAIDYIDRHGTNRLTMRNLGEHLGVEAMSLYRYIRGREDLLEALVAEILRGVSGRLDERLDDQLAEHWQGYLQTFAHEMRQVAIDHPEVFPLVATRHPSTPWLRPPLRSIELVESFIANLTGFNFTDTQIAETYRAFSSFLLGNLLLEAATRGAETSTVQEPLDEGNADIPNEDANIDLTGKPNVTRLRSLLSEDHSLEEFEAALENLLDRLDTMLSQ